MATDYAKISREWEAVLGFHTMLAAAGGAKAQSLAAYLKEQDICDSKTGEGHKLYLRHVTKNTQALKAVPAERIAWIQSQVELYKRKVDVQARTGATTIRVKKGGVWAEAGTIVEPQAPKPKKTPATDALLAEVAEMKAELALLREWKAEVTREFPDYCPDVRIHTNENGAAVFMDKEDYDEMLEEERVKAHREAAKEKIRDARFRAAQMKATEDDIKSLEEGEDEEDEEEAEEEAHEDDE